jgi:hypothetical protein
MAEVRVFHREKFLCRAICAELAGTTIPLREIFGARNRRRRELQTLLRDRKKTVDELLEMPGLEKRLARYPQFCSRIGFAHEFRPRSQSGVRQLLLQRWMPPDLALLKVAKIDPDAIATIIRVTDGNFRLLHRLLTQIERILEINSRIVRRLASELEEDNRRVTGSTPAGVAQQFEDAQGFGPNTMRALAAQFYTSGA